jgi:hypothetical protein
LRGSFSSLSAGQFNSQALEEIVVGGNLPVGCLIGTSRMTMKTFEFSIIASGLDPEAEGFADRFFNAGCDDATLSFQKGQIILDFVREAETIDAAVVSAIACVAEAGAKVQRIEPGPLVSLADIASLTTTSPDRS